MKAKEWPLWKALEALLPMPCFLKRKTIKLLIEKVVSVVDCGIVINPDQAKAQTEGNIIYGLTAALKDGITFKNGVAEQSNFDTYRMLRINEAPRHIEVYLMDNDEAPGGMGEPGLPPIAPALVNAVANLTGEKGFASCRLICKRSELDRMTIDFYQSSYKEIGL